ncbi:MAG: rod shape-determining protein [Paludibacteraceae bacterium]|nr:rod shape-determining protein [Paludibacteraceae bacterium]
MPRKVRKLLAEVLPLVAIELGSHSVRAMAAKKLGPNRLQVLGYEQSQKHPCVEKGVVVQTTNAGYMIASVLKLLANRIQQPELPAAFVVLGGASMQVVPVHSKRDLARRHAISEDLLADMEEECKMKIERRNQGVAVLDLVPSYFVLDGTTQEDIPTEEQRAREIEAHYIAFVGKQDLEEKVVASFDRAAKSIEKTFTRPEALFSAFSFEDQEVLNEGCAILDMGAQTTTLSIYKGNKYLKNKVVPKGGYHITRLLEQQGISFPVAEQLKIQYGMASPDLVQKNISMKMPGSAEIGGVWQTDAKEVATLIRQELDEMIDPLMETLNECDSTISRLYLTGGASMLHGIEDYISSKTNIEVMYGSHAGLLEIQNDEQEEFCKPQYASLVGTLILGSDYRDANPGKLLPTPKIQRSDNLGNRLFELFTEQ